MTCRRYLLVGWLCLFLFSSPFATASPEALSMAYVQAYRSGDMAHLETLFVNPPTKAELRRQLRDFELRGYRLKPLLSRDRELVKRLFGMTLAKRLVLQYRRRHDRVESQSSYLVVHYQGRWLLWDGDTS